MPDQHKGAQTEQCTKRYCDDASNSIEIVSADPIILVALPDLTVNSRPTVLGVKAASKRGVDWKRADRITAALGLLPSVGFAFKVEANGLEGLCSNLSTVIILNQQIHEALPVVSGHP